MHTNCQTELFCNVISKYFEIKMISLYLIIFFTSSSMTIHCYCKVKLDFDRLLASIGPMWSLEP